MPTRLELELEDWLDPSVGGLALDLSPREVDWDFCVDDEPWHYEKSTDKFPTPYFLRSHKRHVSLDEGGYILSLTENGKDCRKEPDVSWFPFEPKNNLTWPLAWPVLRYSFDPFRGEAVPRHIVPIHFKTGVLRHAGYSGFA